ncbi:MAG: diguanylate cyclase [Desulfovibrio sp.]
MFRTIKSRFICGYLGCTAVIVIVLVLIGYYQGRYRLFDLAVKNSMALSTLHADIFGEMIENNALLLKNISSQEAVKNLEVGHILNELARLKKMGKGLYFDAVFIGKDGFVTSCDGVRARGDDRTYYKNVMRTDVDFVLSEPIVGRVYGVPVVGIGVPIIDDSNQLQGALAVSFDLESISERVKGVKVKESSYGWIADQNGMVIAHPNPDYPMNVNINTLDKERYVGADSILASMAVQDEGEGRYLDNLTGVNKIVTFSKIPNTPGWTLFITTDESDVLKQITGIIRNVIGTGVVVLIVFAVIVIHLANSYTKPLNQLTEAVRRSISNFTPLKMKSSDDEIGELIMAYNDMVSAINHYTDELEDLVEERTKELKDVNNKLNAKNAELGDANKNLYSLATRDTLTGLLNRRAIEPAIENEILRSNRFGTPVSLIVLDIDLFKEINDQYGHNVGDMVLKSLGALVADNCRDTDSVARWGGEEFVVLATGTTALSAGVLGEKIRTIIMEEAFDGHRITASFGIASHREGESFSQWFKRADQALYDAKELGRNTVVIDNMDMTFDEDQAASRQTFRLHWRDQYRSGHPVIDQQHRKLLLAANDVVDGVLVGANRYSVSLKLHVLFDVVEHHFSCEEDILKKSLYPGFMEHAEEHDIFKNELKNYIKNYEDGIIDPYVLLRFICQKLVIEHLAGKDSEYYESLENVEEIGAVS